MSGSGTRAISASDRGTSDETAGNSGGGGSGDDGKSAVDWAASGVGGSTWGVCGAAAAAAGLAGEATGDGGDGDGWRDGTWGKYELRGLCWASGERGEYGVVTRERGGEAEAAVEYGDGRLMESGDCGLDMAGECGRNAGPQDALALRFLCGNAIVCAAGAVVLLSAGSGAGTAA